MGSKFVIQHPEHHVSSARQTQHRNLKSNSANNTIPVYESLVLSAKYANSNFKTQENISELKYPHIFG